MCRTKVWRYLIAAGWGAGLGAAWLVFWLVFLIVAPSKSSKQVFHQVDFVYRWTESLFATMADLRLVYAHDVIPFMALQLLSHAVIGIAAGFVVRMIIDVLRGRPSESI